MKYLLSILCLFSFILAEYPYFDDINKQLEFEKNKIYIEDKSGERMLVSGGESYTALANPLGYLLLDEDPDYISKNRSIQTEYEYLSEFNIIRNAKKISEIEFFKIIGLNDEANKIIEDYNKELKIYENKIESHYTITIPESEGFFLKLAGIWLATLGGGSLLFNDYGSDGIDSEASFTKQKDAEKALIFGALVLIGRWLIIKNTDLLKEESRTRIIPNELQSPVIKQTLSNQQLKSLAETYNKQLYYKIKSQ